MDHLSASRRNSLLLALSLSALLPAGLWAQGSPTAIRSDSIDLFATGAVSQTDFDSTDHGFVVGGNITHHLRYLDASLDVRYNHVTGARVGEKSFAGGIKVARQFGRYHPYANLLIGYGVITFDYPERNADGSLYASDDSTVYDFGGGVDIDLTRRFAFKADAQYQSWNLGTPGAASSFSFNPTVLSIGVVYHLPYRFLRPRRY